MAAFDFSLGLRGWRIAELDAVKVERLTELGEGVGIVGVKEGVEVHRQCQREAVGFKDCREEVQVCQQGFGGIEACADIEGGGGVQGGGGGWFVGGLLRAGVGGGGI